MRTSAVKIYVDKLDKASDSRITYSLNRQLKNGRVRKKVILHFKLKGKETYRNSLVFLGMNKTYKWWFRSAGLLRLEDSLKSVLKIKGASSIDQFTLRKYIFIQSLSVALPDFSDKNLILSKLRKKYTNGFKENPLEFSIAIYKNNPKHICLIGIRDFALLRSKIRSGIVWSLSKSNPSKELNRILNKLPCYIAYNEIRKLTGELLDEYEKEDAINKTADDTRKAFIDSLLNLKMKPSKRRKIYLLMVKAFKEKFELHKWARVPQNHIAIRKSLRDAIKSGSLIDIFEDLNANNDVTKTFLYNLSIKLFKMIDKMSNDLKIVKRKCKELKNYRSDL